MENELLRAAPRGCTWCLARMISRHLDGSEDVYFRSQIRLRIRRGGAWAGHVEIRFRHWCRFLVLRLAGFIYIWTAEGWLYVSAVIDRFSRRVVGWSMSASMTAQLVADALLMAVWRRGKPDALMHHSDQGNPVRQRAAPISVRCD